eukprot:11360137-Karenia_brevis.AAC.1
MICTGRDLSHDVVSFSAAISACEKGGQWQRVAPLLNDMHRCIVRGVLPDVMQPSQLASRLGCDANDCQ